ncbi:hypothetical protein D3C71_1107900 [compost metagenome]
MHVAWSRNGNVQSRLEPILRQVCAHVPEHRAVLLDTPIEAIGDSAVAVLDGTLLAACALYRVHAERL